MFIFITFLFVVLVVLIFYSCKAEIARAEEEEKRRIFLDQELYVINYELKKIKKMIDKNPWLW
jgi:hypothetical protein